MPGGRVTGNAFGIHAACWRVFMRPIQTAVEKAEIVVKATTCLRDFLRQARSTDYSPTGFVDSWDEIGEIKETDWKSLNVESQGRMLTNIPPI